MVEATQESTKAFNNLDYNDPRHRDWSLSWAGLGIPWRLLSPWKLLDVIINWSELREINPGYDLRVFGGVAPDQFPVDYINMGLDCRIIALTILGHPADIIFSLDGVNPVIGFQSQGGYLDRLSARYFKIKNTVPGFIANYQLVVIN
jgi:hypothetical protein